MPSIIVLIYQEFGGLSSSQKDCQIANKYSEQISRCVADSSVVMIPHAFPMPRTADPVEFRYFKHWMSLCSFCKLFHSVSCPLCCSLDCNSKDVGPCKPALPVLNLARQVGIRFLMYATAPLTGHAVQVISCVVSCFLSYRRRNMQLICSIVLCFPAL